MVTSHGPTHLTPGQTLPEEGNRAGKEEVGRLRKRNINPFLSEGGFSPLVSKI